MRKLILSVGTNSLPFRNPETRRKNRIVDKTDDVFRVLGPGGTGRLLFLMTVLSVHAIIHSLGFVHAFHITKVEAFTQTITPTIGCLWLVTTLILLAVVYIIAIKKSWWWILTLVVIGISQFLIILSWQDAKFGTLVNLIIFTPILMEVAASNFSKQINEEKTIVLSRSKATEKDIITEQMVAPLPDIVQKWLHNIGIVGHEPIYNAFFKQTGRIKLKPSQKYWFNAVSEQYISISRPSFLWKVNMSLKPYLNVIGRDLFMDGKGKMDIKLASIFPVVKASNNDKISESSLQRYLLEMPWYPSLALHPSITWKQNDDYSATATLSVQGVTGSATFYFDKDGDFIKCSALRYKDIDENAHRLECIGEVKKCSIINGIKIPTEMEISWILENQKKFTWYQVKVEDVVYNLNSNLVMVNFASKKINSVKGRDTN